MYQFVNKDDGKHNELATVIDEIYKHENEKANSDRNKRVTVSN